MILQILDCRERNSNSKIYNPPMSMAEPSWYQPIKEKFDELGICIQLLPFSQINLNKPWIIDARLGWNYSNFSGDIIEDFDENIKNELLYGNAYLLINSDWEGDTYFIQYLYTTLLPNSKIHPRKIIYMSHAESIDWALQQITRYLNIPTDKHITTIFSPHIFYNYHQYVIDFFNYEAAPKERKYLCLNRRARLHRIWMVSLLAYYNCLQYGYVSLAPDAANLPFNTLSAEPKLGIGFSLIKDKLPLVIDIDDFDLNPVHWEGLPVEFYAKTYFSLIPSTHALEDDFIGVSINEKELKAILAKHPFLIAGKPYSLKHLRSLGFMTFEKWFDESYDTEVNDLKRFDMVARETQRLSLLSNDQWDKMLVEMKPIILHNYHRAVKYGNEICYFIGDLKKLLWYVA